MPLPRWEPHLFRLSNLLSCFKKKLLSCIKVPIYVGYFPFDEFYYNRSFFLVSTFIFSIAILLHVFRLQFYLMSFIGNSTKLWYFPILESHPSFHDIFSRDYTFVCVRTPAHLYPITPTIRRAHRLRNVNPWRSDNTLWLNPHHMVSSALGYHGLDSHHTQKHSWDYFKNNKNISPNYLCAIFLIFWDFVVSIP
jgi:hypothetical protein